MPSPFWFKVLQLQRVFSIILQGVADAKCRFICIHVGGYGCQSDGGVFRSTPLYKRLEEGTIIPNEKLLPYTENTTATPIPHFILGDFKVTL